MRAGRGLKGRPRALRRAVEKGRGERGHAAQRERQVPRQLGQRDAGVAADRLRRTSGGAEPAVEFDHMEQVRQLAHLIALPRMIAAAGVKVAIIHRAARSEEHTSELQSLMRISYAVFCLKKKKK